MPAPEIRHREFLSMIGFAQDADARCADQPCPYTAGVGNSPTERRKRNLLMLDLQADVKGVVPDIGERVMLVWKQRSGARRRP